MKPDPKSNQQVFDYIVTKLAEQGKPSVRHDGACSYRGKNECKCAVGFLIPDADYDPVWDTGEGGVPVTRMKDSPRKLLDLKGYDLDFLSDIQFAHDSAKDFKSRENIFRRWQDRFVDLARRCGLNHAKAAKLFEV